jgi:hypothetical protein
MTAPVAFESKPQALHGRAVPLSWQLAMLAAVTIALFSDPLLRLIEVREVNVYAHVEFARRIAEDHVLYPGHFLFHLLTVAVHAGGASWLQANFLVQIAARVGLAAVVCLLFRRSLGGSDRPSRVVAAFAMTMAVMVASALSFPSWPGGHYYLGYLVPNVYVSQTFVLLQPLAVVTFFAVVSVFFEGGRTRGRDLATMAGVAVTSTLAKPSFVMVLLPALCLMLMLTLGRGLFTCRRVLLALVALVAPVAAAMVWIYISTYLVVQGLHVSQGSGIRIAPFQVMAYFERLFTTRWIGLWLGAKFLLSLVFPAAVAIAYGRRLAGDSRFRLAWLQFGFGAILVYFFAEAPMFQAGNFVWSGDIATFILFLVSALCLVEQTIGQAGALDPRARLIAAACYFTLLLHVIAGYGIYVHPVVT